MALRLFRETTLYSTGSCIGEWLIPSLMQPLLPMRVAFMAYPIMSQMHRRLQALHWIPWPIT